MGSLGLTASRAARACSIATTCSAVKHSAWLHVVASTSPGFTWRWETKKRLMDECIEAGALLMFCHGPYPGIGRMRRTEQGFRQWVDEEPVGEGLPADEHDHPHALPREGPA
jgi:hypothetical protein